MSKLKPILVFVCSLLLGLSCLAAPQPSDDSFGSDTEDIVFESSLPELTITFPKDGQELTSVTLNIEGYAKNISLLVVNGEVVPLAANGRINAFAQLREGRNLLRFLGYSKVGQEIAVTRNVIYLAPKAAKAETKAVSTQEEVAEASKIPAPKLVVNLPVDALVLGSQSIVIQGTAQNAETVFVNDEIVPLMGDTYAYSFPISPGVNKFEIKAIGSDKQTTILTREVNLQVADHGQESKYTPSKVKIATTTVKKKQPAIPIKKALVSKKVVKNKPKSSSTQVTPKITLFQPAYRTVSSSAVAISGTVKNLKAVFINGRKVSVKSDHKFYAQVPLKKGMNQITVKGYSSTNVLVMKSVKVKRL